jgi:hypothetical protein
MASGIVAEWPVMQLISGLTALSIGASDPGEPTPAEIGTKLLRRVTKPEQSAAGNPVEVLFLR